VAGRAGRRRHDDPAALGVHQVADEVVREIVARRFSHGDVVPQTSYKEPTLCGHLMQGVGAQVVPLIIDHGRQMVSGRLRSRRGLNINTAYTERSEGPAASLPRAKVFSGKET
jgi:hypothetical protein